MWLYYDNKQVISIVHNLMQHDWTKNIKINRYFIKEKLDSSLIYTPQIPTNTQLADVLTKDVSNQAFQTLIGKLGIDTIYSKA